MLDLEWEIFLNFAPSPGRLTILSSCRVNCVDSGGIHMISIMIARLRRQSLSIWGNRFDALMKTTVSVGIWSSEIDGVTIVYSFRGLI